MKMVVETCAYACAHNTEKYLGKEVIEISARTPLDPEYIGTLMLYIAERIDGVGVVIGTVLFLDDEGYPL